MSLFTSRAHVLSTFHSGTAASKGPTEKDTVYTQEGSRNVGKAEGDRDSFMENVQEIHSMEIHFNARKAQKYTCFVK